MIRHHHSIKTINRIQKLVGVVRDYQCMGFCAKRKIMIRITNQQKQHSSIVSSYAILRVSHQLKSRQNVRNRYDTVIKQVCVCPEKIGRRAVRNDYLQKNPLWGSVAMTRHITGLSVQYGKICPVQKRSVREKFCSNDFHTVSAMLQVLEKQSLQDSGVACDCTRETCSRS